MVYITLFLGNKGEGNVPVYYLQDVSYHSSQRPLVVTRYYLLNT